MSNIEIIRSFPDYSSPGFNMQEYRDVYKDKNVIVHATSSDVFYDEHWGTLTIKSAFNGYESYFLHNCRYKVTDNSFLIINDGYQYSSLIESLLPVESLALFFNRQTVSAMIHYVNSSEIELLDDPFYYRDCKASFDALESRSEGILNEIFKLRVSLSSEWVDQADVDMVIRSILENIIRLKNTELEKIKNHSKLTNAGKKELFQRLNRTKDYIESNFSEEITINDLSRVACLCPNHLIRKFKKHYGTTPHQYLTTVRINNSKELLKNRSYSVTDICTKVGFQSLGSFSSLFAKHCSISPLNYRKKHIKKSLF